MILFIIFYRFIFSIFIATLFPLISFFRFLKKKETLLGMKERYGIYGFKKKFNADICFFCESVGEMKSIIPFINHFSDKKILIVSNTLTSRNLFYNLNFSKNIQHVFTPYDFFLINCVFFKIFKPKLTLFCESNIWPDRLFLAKKYGFKVGLINGRISFKTFKKWNAVPNLTKKIINLFDFIYCNSVVELKKFSKFTTVDGIYCSKVSLFKDIYNNDNSLDLKKLFFSDKKNIFSFISIHKQEELIIANEIQKIITNGLNAGMFLCIRHPNRGIHFSKILNNLNINNILLSDYVRQNKCDNVKQLLTLDIDCEKNKIKNHIVIVDTIGDLDLVFKVSDVSIMCGSFVRKIGGHNPIEPIMFKNAIFSGNYVFNMRQLYEDLNKDNYCNLYLKYEDICNTIASIVNNEIDVLRLAKEQGKYCDAFLNQNNVYFQELLKRIKLYLK